jgi:hypothetical protein
MQRTSLEAESAATVLVATWRDGLFVITGESRRHELAGQGIEALAPDGQGGALAIVSGHSLRRRTSDGRWRTLATSEVPLACCLPVADAIYVGTDDARVLRVTDDGQVEPLPGFDAVPGRDTWYAGSAVIDGRRVGPPLGVRSLAATADAGVLLAGVHVGGIPRSRDRGASWRPTIDIELDVHEVRAHPDDPRLVVAAAGGGFCISRDAGETWRVENDGLHAPYCSAVAFVGDDVLVAASTGHFATQGAVYRRPLDAQQPFARAGGGLPEWIDGIADTRCLATRASTAAVADHAGNLHVSTDAGRSWRRRAHGLPTPSSVVVSRVVP